MSNEVQRFESQFLGIMRDLAVSTKQEKQLIEQNKKVKAELEKAMDEYGVKSIDNEFLKITRVAATSSKSIDLTKLKEKEPGLHQDLLKDYPKVTNRKASVRFTVK